MKLTITNTSQADQGVHAAGGITFIGPGETSTIDVADGYVDRLRALPFFALADSAEPAAIVSGVSGEAPPPADGPDPFDPGGASVAELKSFLSANGVAFQGYDKKSELITLAKRVKP